MDATPGKVFLKGREERRVRAGHLWVFNNEIARTVDTAGDGSLVEIYSDHGGFIGVGYYNRHSLIAVRILSRHQEPIDEGFFRKRIQKALDLRTALYADRRSGRMIYSESDSLPGLIVDRYEDYLVGQVLTLGMERLSGIFMPVLTELLAPKGVLLKNDSPFRQLESLPLEVKTAHGEVPPSVSINEHGLTYAVTLAEGQKTGFFFDQSENRVMIRRWAAGKRVLDCFCYTGGFALNAAAGGAASVLGLDDSEDAIRIATANAATNGLSERVSFAKADCFGRLRDLVAQEERFDLVILDPPAFVKSRKVLAEAARGYKEINLSGMRLLSRGGILVTCSCSHHLSLEDFAKILRSAARDAHRRFRVVAQSTQAPDHPVLLAMPETQYLKCFVLEAMD